MPAEETDAADDDEPPRNAARPQKGASRASNAGVGESKKKPSGKDALATPDGNVVCAQGPRASTGILVRRQNFHGRTARFSNWRMSVV